jgi:hypothetical protein
MLGQIRRGPVESFGHVFFAAPDTYEPCLNDVATTALVEVPLRELRVLHILPHFNVSKDSHHPATIRNSYFSHRKS